MSGQDNYSLLLAKLDQFIRKYYTNQIIRGVLFTMGSVLLVFLAYNLLEHEFYFSKGVRKVLFYSFNAITLAAVAYWVALPVLNYFHLGSTISHEQAARIIGDHFADVKDKLLNILQLKSQSTDLEQVQLIEASVQQKSAQIQLVPFKNAIDLSKNKKHLRFALPPLLLLLALLVGAPSLIKESSSRIIHNDEEFEKAAPFHFKIQDETPAVVQFDNYTLDMEVDGSILPSEVFIEVDQYPYRMNKVDATHYTYTFNNVQKNTGFKMFSGKVNSRPYELAVLKKPNLSEFSIKLDYPAYTGRKDESVQNIGDVLVPQGTKLSWQIDAENTDHVMMSFGGNQPKEINRNGAQYFTNSHQALSDQDYKIYISNAAIPDPDSIQYHLRVIADQHPTIQLEQFIDSAVDTRMIYFAGNGSDDYGLTKLAFNYAIIHPNGKQESAAPKAIPIKNSNKTPYEYQWDTKEIDLQPGDQLSYYFELYDNDAIHGPKSVKSNVLSLRLASKEELEDQNSKNSEDIKDELKEAIEQNRKLQEQMNQLREKMIQEKQANWQDKKELERLMELQKEIQKKIDSAKNKFQENLRNQEKFEKTNDRILEKQEQIEKMFDQLQDPKLQELMDKIQELMQKLEKDQSLPMMDEMKMENKELEKELDRMMELFKTLEVEHQMQQAIDKLKEMAKEEEQISDKTKDLDPKEKTDQQNKDQQNKDKADQDKADKEKKDKADQNKADDQNKDKTDQQKADDQNKDQADKDKADQQKEAPATKEELEKQQEELNKKMEKLEESLEDLKKKNEALERPKKMEDNKEKADDIKKDMEKSSQEMKQSQNSKASKSQKSAANKMKDMAQSMENQMQQQEQEQAEEDVKALRQLLENLVDMSFDQENLIKEVSTTMVNTPKYTDLLQQQFKIKDDFKMIEDSLQELSKRVFQLEAFITEKVNEINTQMASSLDELEQRNKPKAGDNQQRVMKNVNDLALMLSEAMQNMQQQMSGAACANPKKSGKGEGQKPMDKISEGQKGMKEQLEQMKKSMEGKSGEGAGSKEFAKAAARQAALREALKEMQKERQQRGEKTQDLQQIIDGMDKTETELVNKQLTNEMMQRQNEIMTRLLEAENAERERKQDEKRKSETAQELERKLPPSLQEYLKKREAEIDLYKTVSPDVTPYYRSLVEEYMRTLRTENGNTNKK